MSHTPAQKKKGGFRRLIWKMIAGSSLILLIVGAFVLYQAYRFTLPLYERAQTYDLELIDDVETPSIIYDRSGFELGRIYVENRSMIPYEDMPQHLIHCVISQEDQRFWEQSGVDWVGLLRGVWLNFKAGENTQGASTMTMQLSRNVFGLKEEALKRNESGIQRKIVEICVALRIGKLYCSPSGKKYILESYLNRVPFGHGYYGVRSAALGYFGKEPKDLTWEEAASMVACIKNPYAISPLRFPETNKKARDHVFRRLAAEEVITAEEYETYIALPVQTNPQPLKRQTSYVYEKVSKLAKKLVGDDTIAQGGYKIYTTIDLSLQKSTEETLLTQLAKVEATPGYTHPKYVEYSAENGPPAYLQGGVMISDPQTGYVLAHVGGRDYNHTQYDFVESARRPVGTAILPFLYAHALESGYTPASMLDDSPLDNRLVMIGGREGILGEWGAETLLPEYEGDISLRRALQASKVSASIRLGRELSIQDFAEFCEKYEMDFPEEEDLLTRDLLGWTPLSIKETSRAYGSFANGGKLRDDFTYIERIEDSTGTLVYLASQNDTESNLSQVISPSTAFQVFDILSGGLQNGGNLSQPAQSLVRQGFQGGAKTGTPYNFADAWAVGFDQNYVCTTWIGFQKGNNGAILPNGFAKDIAFPVVAQTLSHFDLKGQQGSLPIPETIVAKEICKLSGQLATRYCFAAVESDEGDTTDEPASYTTTQFTEYFRRGTEPTSLCSLHMGLNPGDNFGDKFGPSEGESSARPVLTVKSVKPLGNFVIGGDPYEAVANAQNEQRTAELPENFRSSSLVLNDVIPGEKESMITLPRPKQLQLKLDLESLAPSFYKSSAVEISAPSPEG